jgi:hypothetical protein
MFTRAIFIRPDSELIRESVCACAKLFFDEESTWHKSNRGRTKTLTNSIRKRHKKEDSASFVQKLIKRCYTDLLHFSTRKHNLVYFFRPNRILTVELHGSFLYIVFFSGENAR